jgi:hypothetical protein
VDDSPLKLPIDRLPMPNASRRRFDFLAGQRASEQRTRDDLALKLCEIEKYLGIADAVEEALEKLGHQLFGDLVGIIESNLTAALREVLEQPISLKVEREFKRGVATMSFHVERNGQREDILRGQGGSVANVLSVGLRLFALMSLEAKDHRRFLVLDEQDCWLRPDLVPRLVKIVHEAGTRLGFQILLISHHDISAFDQYADEIYRCTPTPDGVTVTRVRRAPASADPGDEA